MDNITVCGANQIEHDCNLKRFYQAAEKYNLTFSENKSIISKRTISMLGYQIENYTIKPDPNRLEPLLKLPTPSTESMLQRALGLFAYYSNLIQKYCDKIRQLTQPSTFPLSEEACNAYEAIKREISEAIVVAPEDSIPFVLETDAWDHALLLHSIKQADLLYSSVVPYQSMTKIIQLSKKEAYAIVEAIRKWRHYLLGRHFQLISDQRSVSFMFDKGNHGKIKNGKIAR